MVFMNFIIAVISESYEKIMQKLVSQTYHGKVELIAEREMHMTEADFANSDYFPKYIVLRRPANAAGIEGAEWQGFIKDLKQTLKLNNQKVMSAIVRSQEKNLKTQAEIVEAVQEGRAGQNKIEMKMQEIEKKMEEIMKMLRKRN